MPLSGMFNLFSIKNGQNCRSFFLKVKISKCPKMPHKKFSRKVIHLLAKCTSNLGLGIKRMKTRDKKSQSHLLDKNQVFILKYTGKIELWDKLQLWCSSWCLHTPHHKQSDFFKKNNMKSKPFF